MVVAKVKELQHCQVTETFRYITGKGIAGEVESEEVIQESQRRWDFSGERVGTESESLQVN